MNGQGLEAYTVNIKCSGIHAFLNRAFSLKFPGHIFNSGRTTRKVNYTGIQIEVICQYDMFNPLTRQLQCRIFISWACSGSRSCFCARKNVATWTGAPGQEVGPAASRAQHTARTKSTAHSKTWAGSCERFLSSHIAPSFLLLLIISSSTKPCIGECSIQYTLFVIPQLLNERF
jgi:hypothetical protein